MTRDVNETERKVLHYMYDNTATTLSKEWFLLEHKQKLIDIITKSELLEETKETVAQSVLLAST